MVTTTDWPFITVTTPCETFLTSPSLCSGSFGCYHSRLPRKIDGQRRRCMSVPLKVLLGPGRAFIRESNAVIAHNALAQLAHIKAPTQITLGRHDQVCGPRFADTLTKGIEGSEQRSQHFPSSPV
jgi:hypothetical protein